MQVRVHLGFSRSILFSKEPKVLALLGVAAVREFDSVRENAILCPYEVVRVGNFDREAKVSKVAGRVIFLYEKVSKKLCHIVLTAYHPENFLFFRDMSYRQAYVQDVVVNLTAALCHVPLEIVSDKWTKDAFNLLFADALEKDMPLISEAAALMRQEILDHQAVFPSLLSDHLY